MLNSKWRRVKSKNKSSLNDMNKKNILFLCLFRKKSWVIYFDYLFKFLPMFLLSLLMKHSKQLWLINERPDDARDNGYFFFKWLRENHPEVPVFYAIRKKSNDYEKVRPLGNVVEWRSLWHFKCYVFATIICSTHGFAPHNLEPFLLRERFVRRFMPVKGKKVFLRHGIAKDKIPYYTKSIFCANLFVCSAYREWEFVTKNFGYREDEVKCLGFARYDSLINTNVKKQILYMPTWRRWIHSRIGCDIFINTNYYKTLVLFLSSPELQTFLNESKTEFVFFIHPSFKRFEILFKNFANENIKVMSNFDSDLQPLLKSCSMLITDYSSVAFDIAYLNKPIIYYQTDYDEYSQRHYPEGYFSYKRDGFGPVIDNIQDVITQLKKLDSTDYINPEVYSKRSENFYMYRDKNNCQRIYDEICKMESIILLKNWTVS